MNPDPNAKAVSLQENDEIDQRVNARTRELLTAQDILSREIVARKQAEAQLTRQTTRLKILADASQAFATVGLDYQALLEQVAQQIATAFGDFCAIRLLTDDGNWLEPAAAHDTNPEFLAAMREIWPHMPIALDSTEQLAQVARTGQPFLVPVISLERVKLMTRPAVWEQLERFHHHSLIAVPLRVHGRSIGTMNLGRARLDQPPFTADDLKLAQDLADRAALAISNAQLLKHVQDELAERRRAEDQLIYQANLLTNVSDAIISTDLAFNIKSWNRAAETLYGWSAVEVIGQEMGKVVPSEHLDLQPAQALQQFRQTGQWRGEVTQIAKDGTQRSILSSVTLLRGEAGEPSGAIAINRDITEQVQTARALQASQALLQSTIDSLSAHICVLDEAGTIIATNNLWRNFAETNGGHSKQSGEGVNYLQICEETQGQEREDALTFAAGIRAVSEGQHHYFEFEYACPSPSEQRWFMARVTPLIGSPATKRRVVVAHENITAVKKLETENERLMMQFHQAQKMESIGRLAGGIAHDFNNLLMPIIGYAELGMKRVAPEHQLYTDLHRIKEAGDRAAGLTRQILAFSRQQLLEMKTLDLNEVITRFVPMLRRLIGEDIVLQTHLAADLPLLLGDTGQLEQILLNLAVNARDAMIDGGTFTIETAYVELDERFASGHVGIQPGPHARLTVSDTGYGMNVPTQQRIFEPFFTTKPRGEGTGLGLATVFGIVKQHHGSIWVDSEVGHGTTFKIYLPLPDAPHKAAETVQPAVGFNGTETVLLVEDEISVRQLVGDILRAHGYHVLEASEPQQAIALAATKADTINLLLSDVIMPQMNGRKLYEQLVAAQPTLKVLFMSGYTDNIIAQHDVLTEETAFIQKPFAIDNLLLKVRTVLERTPGRVPAVQATIN